MSQGDNQDVPHNFPGNRTPKKKYPFKLSIPPLDMSSGPSTPSRGRGAVMMSPTRRIVYDSGSPTWSPSSPSTPRPRLPSPFKTTIRDRRIFSDTFMPHPDRDMSVYDEMLADVLHPPPVSPTAPSRPFLDAAGPTVDCPAMFPLVPRAPKTRKKIPSLRRAVSSPYGTRSNRMESSPCVLSPMVRSPGSSSRRCVDLTGRVVSLNQFEWFNDGKLAECEWNNGCTFMIDDVNRAAMVTHLSSSHHESLQYGARCNWGYCNGCDDYGVVSALADHIMKVHMEMNVRLCPCCHEHLESDSDRGVIRRHMRNKHADFVLDETTPLSGGIRSKFSLA